MPAAGEGNRTLLHPKRGVTFSADDVLKSSAPSSSRSARWRIPARYEVKELIGTGAYGSVCEAFDKERNGNVAIKKIGDMFEDLIDCKRILREIAILSKLSHDHIVRLYDIPVPNPLNSFEELFIVMEICDSDMKKLCRTDVSLSPLHITTLLYNLLVGVNYLHSAGIYHRDLKPANCLVNQDCSVKICDFGLSRAMGEAEQQHLGSCCTPRPSCLAAPIVPSTTHVRKNLTGHVVTRWYRAPELILLQENYTEAIDVWSVGCIHAELLGMLEGIKVQDRAPLFPGSSCFPLSPDNKHKTDYKHHTRGKQEQLNMIFNLLGTPPDEDIEQLERADAKHYIRCFAKREGTGVIARFPLADTLSINLIAGMLQLNPAKRMTVAEALNHDLFKDIRDPSKETSCALGNIVLEFEKEPDLDEASLRHYFRKEIKNYHPEIERPEMVILPEIE